jgi:hypothetical protein
MSSSKPWSKKLSALYTDELDGMDAYPEVVRYRLEILMTKYMDEVSLSICEKVAKAWERLSSNGHHPSEFVERVTNVAWQRNRDLSQKETERRLTKLFGLTYDEAKPAHQLVRISAAIRMIEGDGVGEFGGEFEFCMLMECLKIKYENR